MYENLEINAMLMESNYTLQIMPQVLCFIMQMILTVVHHMYIL